MSRTTVVIFAVLVIFSAQGCSKSDRDHSASGVSQTPGLQSVAAAADGPFGFAPGMPKETIDHLAGPLESVVAAEPGAPSQAYVAHRAPKPSPDFAFYDMLICPKRGLVELAAEGREIESGSDGSALRFQFTKIVDLLESKYGPADQKVDHLKPGSPWKAPEYWMMALNSGDRLLAAKWERPNLRILASVKAASFSKGNVWVEYDFPGRDEVRAEIKAEKAKTL